MDEESHVTTKPEVIEDWAKERGGVPAFFLESEDDIEPQLHINFAASDMDERLQEVTWDIFFEEFEAQKLAFRYKQVNADGRASNYYEFVNRGEV